MTYTLERASPAAGVTKDVAREHLLDDRPEAPAAGDGGRPHIANLLVLPVEMERRLVSGDSAAGASFEK